MKKLILALAIAFAVTAYAADRQIDYFTWAYDHNATDLTDTSTGILKNYDVLWQLIYTPNTSGLAPDLSNTDTFLASGEVLIGSRYLTSSTLDVWQLNLLPDWDTYDSPVATFSPDASASSYNVYQRIYELDPGTTAPVAGTYYYDSDTVDLTKQAEWNSDLPFAVYAMGDEQMSKGVQPTLQVQGSTVPEPATMSLLGLGALAMVLRRKLRK